MKYAEKVFHAVVLSCTLGFYSALAFSGQAMVVGKVTQVVPNYQTIEKRIPVEECRLVEVPVTKKKEGSDDVLTFIVGAAIGSAVGNQVSGESGAGAVGAIVGGALANEHQKKHNSSEEIVGYRQINQCTTTYNSQTTTIVKDYTVTYESLGYSNTIVTKQNYSVGQNVEVFVNFSLKYN